jgi:hypothetical protein
MPWILAIRQDETSPDVAVEHGASNAVPTRTWIIIAVVIAVLITAGTAVLVIIRSKRRQYRKALEKDPYLSRKEFMRRRKLSALDLQAEEERQRHSLIRKSLATRSSKSLSISRIDVESIDSEEQGLGRFQDWKEWEAALVNSQRKSHQRHPSLTSLPGLPAPVPARSPSPSRSRTPLLHHHTSPPWSQPSSY